MKKIDWQKGMPWLPPRLLSMVQAAEYCGLTTSSFHRWVKDGRLPGPLPGTARWDRMAIDDSIDTLSKLGGLIAPVVAPLIQTDPFDEWKKKRDARRNRGG